MYAIAAIPVGLVVWYTFGSASCIYQLGRRFLISVFINIHSFWFHVIVKRYLLELIANYVYIVVVHDKVKRGQISGINKIKHHT